MSEETKTEVKSITFWRKSYPVEAVRLTKDNYRLLAEEVDGSVVVDPDGAPMVVFKSITGQAQGEIGSWIVQVGERMFLSFTHENFLRKFNTHIERLNEDEKYAKVHNLVLEAMRKQDTATYHGDSNGMDLVAIEVTKKILSEL